MAPTKKRKQQPQSTTLLEFFSAGSAKKGKFPPTSTKRATPPTKEVIVIDSDEDKGASAPKTRPRAESTSSDIEFVEDEQSKEAKTEGDIVIAEASSHQQHISFGKPSALLRSSLPSPLRESEISMTRVSHPSDLLSSRSASSPSLNTGKFEDASGFSGIPTAASSSSASHQSAAVTLAVSTHIARSSSDEHHMVVDSEFHFDEGDAWAMGDDEMASTDPGGQEGEALGEEDVDLISATCLTQVCTCPICNKLLVDMQELEVQDHVNRCIDLLSTSCTNSSFDQPPAPSSTTFTPSSKPLRPLSALQTPHNKRLSSVCYVSSEGNSNAFSVLMSSLKEDEMWKEAMTVENPNFRPNKMNGGRRKAPFYKVLQGMPIAVDAFRYGSIPGVTAYFLTHAHSDHYTNLSSTWKSGPIYCSQATANLIIHMLSVDPKWVHPLPMDTASVIPNTGGVQVTLIEANHCPGSCLFLYEGKQTTNAGDSTHLSPFVGSTRTFRYLHCGDFRASPTHVLHPAVKGKRIDHVYLDTTYLDPKYTFPPQPLVINACSELAKRIASGKGIDGTSMQKTVDGFMNKAKGKQPEKQDRVLFVVGTYSIGKERIVKALAEALQTKIYCDPRKAAILRCQSDPELHALLTSNPLDASVHLVPLGIITSDKLKTYIEKYQGFTRTVAFRPTGWSYTPPAGSEQSPSIPHVISRSQQHTFTYANLRPARNSSPTLQLYGVPYSEHSSFFELTCFAMSFDWGKMIATVNVGSETSRGKMAKWVAKWEAERKKRGNGGVVPYRKADYW